VNAFFVVVIGIAAFIVAWQTIWKRFLVPLARFVKGVIRIADATPVLVQIAEEFRPNGGGTVRDVVDRIETKVDNAAQLVREATDSWAADRESVLRRLVVVEERQKQILTGVSAALAAADSFPELVAGVAAALGPGEPNG
jgi:phytoene/squalene synthetase